MSERKRKKFVVPSSSESENEDNNTSSAATSFESNLSMGGYHPQAVAKGILKKPDENKNLQKGREKRSTSKKRESPRKKKNQERAGTSRDHSHSRPISNSEDDEEKDRGAVRRSPKGRQPAASSQRNQMKNQERAGTSRDHSHSRPISNSEESDRGTVRRSSRGRHPSPSSRRNQTTHLRRRALPGAQALREIRQYQKSTNLLLSKLPFSRVVREVSEVRHPGMRWQVLALEALQEATEIFLVHLFEDAVLCTLHRGRVTLNVRDMHLARRIRSRYEDF